MQMVVEAVSRKTNRKQEGGLFKRGWAAALALLLAGGALLGGYTTAQASTTVSADGLPNVQADSGSSYLIGSQADKPFRESPITYKGKSAYYLVTRDPAYSARDGETVYVSFNGTSGSVSDAGTADGDTVFAATVIYLAGGEWSQYNLLQKANSTIFFDAGEYRFTNPVNYTNMSADNLALVGLQKGAVVLTRQPYLRRTTATATPAGFHERIYVANSGMLWQNLVFDGENNGLLGGSETGSIINQWSKDGGVTWGTSGAQIGSGRGGSALAISAGISFVLRDSEVRNFAGGRSTTMGNYGLLLIGGTTTTTVPDVQVNLEGVTITNVKGGTTDSFRVVCLNPHPNVNVKDMTIDRGTSGNQRDPLWIETPLSAPNGLYDHAVDVRFAGSLSFPGYDRQRLGAQITSFENVTPPAGYRWAAFAVGDAKAAMSLTNQADVLFYRSLADFKQDWPSADTAKFLLFDTADNTWVVREPSATNGVVPTIARQLQGINHVMTKMGAALDDAVTGTHGRGLNSGVYVKVVADDNGEFPQFSVPEFATSYSSATPNVHLRAVPTPETLFSAPNTGTSDMIPAPEGGVWSLDAASAANVRIYGVNFATNAHYTLHEATIGGTTQDQDSVPGTDAAAVENSTESTFESCEFVSLAHTLRITDPAEADVHPGVGAVTATVGDTIQPLAAIVVGWTHAAANGATSTFVPDDDTITWTSSDSGVASVDPQTGEVSVLTAGSATITACAVDTYNQGEIARPCDSFVLTAGDVPPTPDPTPTDPTPSNPTPDDHSTDGGNPALPSTGGASALALPLILTVVMSGAALLGLGSRKHEALQ
jgi:hypothetical protein